MQAKSIVHIPCTCKAAQGYFVTFARKHADTYMTHTYATTHMHISYMGHII
jgi:hypothetical protein